MLGPDPCSGPRGSRGPQPSPHLPSTLFPPRTPKPRQNSPEDTTPPPQHRSCHPPEGLLSAPGCVTSPAPAKPVAIYLAVATFEDHSKGSVSYQVLLAVLKVPHHLHHPSARGMKPPGRTKGKQRGSSSSYSRLTAAGGGVGACPGPGCPRRRGQLLSYRRRPPGRRGCCRASPRRGAPSGMGRGKRGISGAGCEGTARHRRRDEGPSQRGRGLRALPLFSPMAPPQRGLPAPRPRSGTEPQSIQRREGRRGRRLRGWLSLSPPQPSRERRMQ